MPDKIIGISLGDPAGIGPEVFLKAFREISAEGFIPLVSGDIPVLERNFESLGISYRINKVVKADDIRKDRLNVYSAGIITRKDFPAGKDSKICGMASFAYVENAVKLWKEGITDALVTLPISKKAWHLAGKKYAGHTEYLASALGCKSHAMIMAAGRIRALLVTTHVPLKEVPAILTSKLIVEKAIVAYRFLKESGIVNPSIAFAALNPHAGEDGILGTEEKTVISPAISTLKQRGITCTGPMPADSVFRAALDGKADMVAAMYHDQAMIPLKTFYPGKLVNCTAGLKMVRTSPGHGTAFDISYSNSADPSSFIEAFRMAACILEKRPLA
jgi:4-hydroxythreonine-4-phosphate dehydrogenase